MRLLIVVPTLDPQAGGTSATARSLARMMLDRGHQVSIWTTDLQSFSGSRWVARHPRPAAPRPVEGAHVRYFRTRWPRRWARCPEMRSALRGAASEFDVAYVYSLYLYVSWRAARSLRRQGIPYVLFVHGSLYPFLRKKGRIRKAVSWWLFDRQLFRNAAAVHAATHQEYLINKSVEPQSTGVVIPHCIDLRGLVDLPSKGTFRRMYPGTEAGRLIVFIGRIVPQKGLETLVEAFALCHRANPHIRLILAGPDGGSARQLRRFIRSRGVEDEVHFTGYLDGRKKLALLSDAEIWACISRADNFGMAAVEALGCGVPVVISDDMGIHDVVDSERIGLVVPRSAERASEAILQLLSEQRETAQMGARAKAVIAARYSPEVVSVQVEALFLDVTAGRVGDGVMYASEARESVHGR